MTGKRQRAGNARAAGDGMKMHRRTLRLDGRDHTVISLRPGTKVRYSSNYFHDTWHVLSDQHGADVMARLLWGLSYQSRPGTVLVVDWPFLTGTPFDADPADPIVLVPGWHTPFTQNAARDLARSLPLKTASEGTVRWKTHGLDTALADSTAWWEENGRLWERDRGRIAHLNGLIVLAPHHAGEMRAWAMKAGALAVDNPYGMDYEYIGPAWFGMKSWKQDGEFQIFRDFHRDVGTARRARAEVLERPEAPAESEPKELRPHVWRQLGAIDRGRSRKLANCRGVGRETAEALAAAGFHTLDHLAEAGAVRTYLALRADEHDMLWTLEGALQGCEAEDVPAERRTELLDELRARTRRR